jgi:hypothetical protein
MLEGCVLIAVNWTNDAWLWVGWIIPIVAALAGIIAVILVVTLTNDHSTGVRP